MSAPAEASGAERALALILRAMGTAGLAALPFVFIPYAWMDAIHGYLGLGTLPPEPIVGYLARSLSGFYAFTGGLLWVLSFDPARHRAVLVYLGIAFAAFGAALFWIDHVEGLPLSWRLWEGPFVFVFGVSVTLLARAQSTRER